jgi:hypothetical protein
MKYIPVFAISLLLFSCGSKLRTDDGKTIRLTGYKTWPDSLVLEIYEGGGMVNASTSLRISKDSCYILISGEGADNRYTFGLDASELDQLFKTLLENNIEQLDVKKTNDIIYDKGTTSLDIILGRKHVNISDGASGRITELHQGDFMRIYSSLQAIAHKKIADQKQNCCFNFDPSIKLKGKNLSVICMNADTSFSDSAFLLKDKICFRLLRGMQNFQIHITQKGKVNYTNYFSSIYPKFNLQKDTSFTLKIKNDTLLVIE